MQNVTIPGLPSLSVHDPSADGTDWIYPDLSFGWQSWNNSDTWRVGYRRYNNMVLFR